MSHISLQDDGDSDNGLGSSRHTSTANFTQVSKPQNRRAIIITETHAVIVYKQTHAPIVVAVLAA